MLDKRRVNNYAGAADGDAIGIIQVVRVVDMQFEVFKILGLLILQQRYINEFLTLAALENKPSFLLGFEVFATNGRPIHSFVSKDEGLLDRVPQLYRKTDKTFVFICGNTANFYCPVQRLRHDCRYIGTGVIIDVNPIEPKHQLGGTGNIGRQYGGSRFQRIQYGDRRPLDLRPTHQPDWHIGGAFHLTVQYHQQIGVRKLQAACIHQNAILCLVTRFKVADFVVVNQLVQLADGGIVRLLKRRINFRALLRAASTQCNGQQKQPGNQQALECFHTALRPSD